MLKIKQKNSWDDVALMSMAALGLFLIAFFTFAVFYFSDFSRLSPPDSNKIEHFGQLGDFIGGVLNPLLSFLAFIAVVISFRAQSKSYKKSEEAATALSKNQSEQLNQLVKQGGIAERQAFENVFFGLLQLHSRNIQSVRYSIEKIPYSGYEAFGHIANSYAFPDGAPEHGHRFAAYWQAYEKIVNDFSQKHGKHLSHYFMTVQQIFLYIEGSEALSPEQKKRYVDIYFSSLSPEEVSCIFLMALAAKSPEILDRFISHGIYERHPQTAAIKQMRTVAYRNMNLT